jgi:hypothetical protein
MSRDVQEFRVQRGEGEVCFFGVVVLEKAALL